jgi:DnaJ-class molecular chaperone
VSIEKTLEGIAERLVTRWLKGVEKKLAKGIDDRTKRLEAVAQRMEKTAPAPEKTKKKTRRRPTKAEEVELAYRYLGVQKGDPESLVRSVFRAKAKHMHPDKKTGDKVAFQRLETAMKLVLDDLKRKRGK